VEITIYADPLYQHLVVTTERKFWRCVESGEPPRLFRVEPQKQRIQAVRSERAFAVTMGTNTSRFLHH
jgi:hypothetical protein